jgi:osmoprotectant transport system substrate-binding protein
MRLRRTGTVGAILAAVALAATACGSGGGAKTATGSGGSSTAKPAVVVGGANFSEATLLAYIYGDALKNAGYPVSFKTGIGPRETVQPAMESGTLNFEAEYSGNLLAYYDPSAAAESATATAAALEPYLAKHGLTEGVPSAATDADSIAVNSQTEAKYHLTSIAQLAPIAGQLAFGGPPECRTRTTCLVGLKTAYGITFKTFDELDSAGPITVSALKNNQVQVARLDSSDPNITADHFTVLADPKNFQDAGNIIPEFSKKIASAQLVSIANQVSAALNTAELRQMDGQITNSQESPATVAQQFVSAHHLG